MFDAGGPGPSKKLCRLGEEEGRYKLRQALKQEPLTRAGPGTRRPGRSSRSSSSWCQWPGPDSDYWPACDHHADHHHDHGRVSGSGCRSQAGKDTRDSDSDCPPGLRLGSGFTPRISISASKQNNAARGQVVAGKNDEKLRRRKRKRRTRLQEEE